MPRGRKKAEDLAPVAAPVSPEVEVKEEKGAPASRAITMTGDLLHDGAKYAKGETYEVAPETAELFISLNVAE